MACIGGKVWPLAHPNCLNDSVNYISDVRDFAECASSTSAPPLPVERLEVQGTLWDTVRLCPERTLERKESRHVILQIQARGRIVFTQLPLKPPECWEHRRLHLFPQCHILLSIVVTEIQWHCWSVQLLHHIRRASENCWYSSNQGGNSSKKSCRSFSKC